jgi:molecular chaperone DnaK
MVRDAESHASEDKQRRERIDARNALDAMVYEAEKTLREHRERIPVAQLNSLEKAIEATKPLLANENAEASELKAKGEELQRALHAVSESLYKAESAARAEGGDASGQGPAPEGGSGTQDDGQVVDADFTEEK